MTEFLSQLVAGGKGCVSLLCVLFITRFCSLGVCPQLAAYLFGNVCEFGCIEVRAEAQISLLHLTGGWRAVDAKGCCIRISNR